MKIVFLKIIMQRHCLYNTIVGCMCSDAMKAVSCKTKATFRNCSISTPVYRNKQFRKQRICINGVMSEWKIVLSGVPQGSILGPILFMIYINDLDINILLKFADDTKLFGSVTLSGEQLSMQNDRSTLLSWSVEG